MARMSDSLRQIFSGNGSFADRVIDLFDSLTEFDSSKRPFKRAYIFEPLEERIVLNAAPTFVNLPDEITVVAGSSYHVALNGYDEDGDALTFTAESVVSNLATVLDNTSAKMHIVQRDADGNIIQDFGYITFEFFEDDAPLTTARIKQLIQENFYDGIIFHRIIDNFMVQGGDPTGTGASGSTYADFNDEFSDYLRHNSQGILSMANSGANTNNSQFFITDVATPWLDDQHSIFAFLTSGYDVLEEVSKVATDTTENEDPYASTYDRPIFDVVMEEVTLFDDTENGVLRIVTSSSMANTTQIVTVKVDDGNGGYVEKEISVRITSGDLEEPEQVNIKAGETTYVNLPKLENMGDDESISYFVIPYEQSHPNMQYEIVEGNRLKITAGEDVAGPQYVYIGVQSALDGWIYSTESSYVGRYMLTLVTPAAPKVTWTDGDNGTVGDGITSNNNKDGDTTYTFKMEGIIPGATVNLYANGVEMPYQIISDIYYDDAGNEITNFTSETTIASRAIIIKTIGSGEYKLNDGTYQFTAKQTHTIYDGTLPLVSDLSTPIQVIVATVAPEFLSPIEGFKYDVSPGDEFVVEIKTNKDDAEGGVTIELVGETPQGMAMFSNASYPISYRALAWNIPEDYEAGSYEIQLKATDGAGNSRTVTFNLMVQTGPKFDVIGETTVNEGDSLSLTLQPSDWIEVPTETGESDDTDESDTTGDVENSDETGTPTETGESDEADNTNENETSGDVENSDVTGTPTETGELDEADNTNENETSGDVENSDETGTPIEIGESDEADNTDENETTGDVENSDETGTPTETGESDEADNTNENGTTGDVENSDETGTPTETGESDETANDGPREGGWKYEIIDSTLPEDAHVRIIHSDNGRTATLVWDTTEADGPGLYTVTLQATDENGITRQKMIQVTVNEVNAPPYFVAEDFEELYSVNEHEEIVINVNARDDDVPRNTLTYSLIDSDIILTGMEINAATGRLTWTPGEEYGGQTYTAVVQVADQSGATARYTIRIAVNETDTPPVFTEIDPIEVYDDFGDLSIFVEAVDPDSPTNLVRYSLDGDIPEGMTINPNTGEIRWAIPHDYVGMNVPSALLNVHVKATEIVATQVTNELGEYEFIESEGLSTVYTVSITLKSRSYEIAVEEAKQAEAAAVVESAIAVRNAVWENYDRPTLPGTDTALLSLHLHDVWFGNSASNADNSHRQNAALETPLYDKNYNGSFRDPFSTVTFGTDDLGTTNDADLTTSTDQENESSPPPTNSGTSDGQTYRARRPVSPSAFLRGIENGLSRVSTPLLDSLNNINVDRTVSELQDANASLQSYYDSLPKKQSAEQIARDTAIRNWNDTNPSSADNSPDVNQKNFNTLRLK
ncbi:MAG: peptidylprolyl isomerase [Planctomycetaceae bacterium]|jgi:cyclophilin family peptidyl-prolyl cis-trans isomerase|nr:peptidylprolyl isomerase [Planctomycetaceae bacterium]